MDGGASLAGRVAAGDRRALARAITLVEFDPGRPPGGGARAPRRARDPAAAGAPGRADRDAGRRQVELHREPRADADRGRRAARGAGGRSLLDAVGRLDPRRQDPDGAAGAGAGRLHPAEPEPGGARRRRPADPRDDPAGRGLGRRRGAGRDGRRRAVGDDGRGDDRRLRAPDRAGRRRRAAGGQARHHGDGRPDPRQQGGRSARARGGQDPRRLCGRAAAAPAAAGRPGGVAEGLDGVGADRGGAARGLGGGRGAGGGPAGERRLRGSAAARRRRPGSPMRSRPG